jgi:HlyD family secretion protein
MIAAATMAIAIAWTVTQINSLPAPVPTTSAVRTPTKPTWAASAAGRVEPRGGEIKIGAQTAGRIADIAVKINDVVQTGDLLIRLDDDEAYARIAAAESEAAVRKRERDAETVSRPAQDRRNAEDAVATAERALAQARADLDGTVRNRTTGGSQTTDQTALRAAVKAAQDKLAQERDALRRVQLTAGMPLPTRLEAALTAARSDLSLAEAAFERTRIRAPSDGTVLQVNARGGETTSLRVRAELEERDSTKVRVGQAAVVQSDAHPGRKFEGKVVTMAQALGPSKLAQRGPRRPNDVEVLEVVVDLDANSGLLPGMRVDVFLKPDATVQNQAEAKSN